MIDSRTSSAVIDAKSDLLGRCPVCPDVRPSRVWGENQTWINQGLGPYRVFSCGQCGLAFSLPRPTEAELIELYSKDYLEGDGCGYTDYTVLPELNMKRMWPDLRQYAPIDSVKPRSILDVGCATGAFLSQAQADGWACVGVDPIEDAVLRARELYKMDARVGDIFSLNETNHFGLLTMWHVIEHVVDPIAVLQRAHRLLAPNGLLFMETPNWKSAGRLIKGPQWKQIRPPEHINFFDVDSFTYAAEKAGFKVERCDTLYQVVVDANFFRSPKRILMSVAGKAASMLNHGGYLRLLARKVK